MKVCLGQINTTPGDFDGNLAAIIDGIDVAAANDCDVIVFPELCIPGYLHQDLIYHTAYVDRNLAVLDQVRAYTLKLPPTLHVVVGFIDRNEGAGKPFFNRAAVISAGEIVGVYTKQLLPFYDVFDELRYYEPGSELLTVTIAGRVVGITICEDLWNDKASDDYSAENNPYQRYRDAGVNVVLSLNASPFVQDKTWQRMHMIAPGTLTDMSVIYVNQWGGQDELVFDGQSFVVRNGDLLHLSRSVEENSFDVVDLDQPSLIADVYLPEFREAVRNISADLYRLLVVGLRDYARKSGFSQIVLASSGGVDSAVVCQLACDAIGAKNVHAIRMPSIFSSDHSRDDAIALHDALGCWDYEVGIDHKDMVERLNELYRIHGHQADNLVASVETSGRYNHTADENIQARLRDVYLMHFSNAFGAMPLSTGNKTESACGYYTHFDMNFSYAPIKDLYKFEVMEIAQNCAAIPENIWRKPPSAELAPDQTDEASLLSYAILDPIVRAYVEDYVSRFEPFLAWLETQAETGRHCSIDPDALARWTRTESAAADFDRIISLMGKMEYKRRQTCPGTKVTGVAFGIGRRIPIVEKWS